MLDFKAQLLSEANVGYGDMPDTFDKYGGEIERASESKGKQNGQFMGGVDTVDIKTRVRLGITQSLRLCQNLVKCGAISLHLTKNVVAGAVNDAKQPPQAIRGEATG